MKNYTDYLRYRATRLEEFANPCHSPDTGEFCETPDTERYYKDYKLEYISPEMGSGLHKIVATLGDTKVAEMQWSPKQIEGLDVNDEHQRKGIARAMWEWGQEMKTKPKHSNDRTTKGDLWAKAIGGKLPRLKPQPEFATTVELYNACHDPANGRFCETQGHPRPERTIPVQSAEDELDEHNRVEALIKHYGRGEFADEMGGTVWAMTGESSGVTEAAEAILDAQPFDPNDDFRGYYRSQYDIAKTILDTVESERSDVPLFSGHRRGQEDIDAMVEEGVSFPLVATSPDQRLAEQYAGFSGKLVKAVIFEFPSGTQSGFYQANEHIATGEFEVEFQETDSMGRVRMKLRQTRSSRVPKPRELEEEEE